MLLSGILLLTLLAGFASCQQEGNVRLIKKGEEKNEGNVEVFLNGIWSGVCGDNSNTWDMDAIMVVCGQLDYPYATTPSINGYYSRPNVTYLVHDMMCKGDESNLLECSYSNYTTASTDCDSPATAACITGWEVMIYALSFFLSCLFCCCSTFIILLMCFMIASCPLAALSNTSRRPSGGVVIEDPSRPLMIDPNTNYKTKPPAYTV